MALVRLPSSLEPSPVHSPARGGTPGDKTQGYYSLQMIVTHTPNVPPMRWVAHSSSKAELDLGNEIVAQDQRKFDCRSLLGVSSLPSQESGTLIANVRRPAVFGDSSLCEPSTPFTY